MGQITLGKFNFRVEPSDKGGWILNPEGTFKLTIQGIDSASALQLKGMLAGDSRSGAPVVVDFLLRSGATCLEVEDYVREYRPIFLSKVEELRAAALDKAELAVEGGERLEADSTDDFESEALYDLDVLPAVGDAAVLLKTDADKSTAEERRACARSVAEILLHTYTMSALAARERRHSQQDGEEGIEGWEVLATEDSCPFCLRAAEKTYPKDQCPLVPLHIGCRCTTVISGLSG